MDQVNKPWLRRYSLVRSEKTAREVEAAVISLKSKGEVVSVASIVAEVKRSTGRNLASSTIFRNPAAYRFYRENADERQFHRRPMFPVSIFEDYPEPAASQARAHYLSRERKRDLILRIVDAESQIRRLEEENCRLREVMIEKLPDNLASG